jgi:hypothetical protein
MPFPVARATLKFTQRPRGWDTLMSITTDAGGTTGTWLRRGRMVRMLMPRGEPRDGNRRM